MSWISLVSLGMTGVFSNNPGKMKTMVNIISRSASYAILAYFGALLTEKLVIAGCALLQGYSVILNFYTVKIIATDQGWTQDSVVLLYIIPFLFQIFLFIWLYIRFIKEENNSNYGKFRLWLMFFLLYRITGMIPAHLLAKSGIDYVLTWLYAGIAFKIIVGVTGAVIFILAGKKLLVEILAISGVRNTYTRDAGISVYFTSIIFLPVAIVSGIAVLFYIPKFPMEELFGIVLLIFLLVYFMISISRHALGLFLYKEDIRGNKNIKFLLISSIFGILILRILFGTDIHL